MKTLKRSRLLLFFPILFFPPCAFSDNPRLISLDSNGSINWVEYDSTAFIIEAPGTNGLRKLTYIKSETPVILVKPTDDFQKIVNSVEPGSIIKLEPGKIYPRITLPLLNSTKTTIITSSAILPERRITPADQNLLPVIEDGLLILGDNWKLDGLKFKPKDSTYTYALISVGEAENKTVQEKPNNIIIDRCLLVGDQEKGGKRGVELNSRLTRITRSWISNFWSDFQDAQAIASWNGAGPFFIHDNFLEASGENILFGGAAPSTPNIIPADIEITKNTFNKPPEWEASSKSVKNHLEVKNGQRIKITGNLFEHNWIHSQNGVSVGFLVMCQGQLNAVVKDVLFENNIIRDVEGGIAISGMDSVNDNPRCGEMNNVVIRNNLIISRGLPFLVESKSNNLTISNNTAINGSASRIWNLALLVTGEPSIGFKYSGNIANHSVYGVGGDYGYSMNYYFPDGVWETSALGNCPYYANYKDLNITCYSTMSEIVDENYRSKILGVGADIDKINTVMK